MKQGGEITGDGEDMGEEKEWDLRLVSAPPEDPSDFSVVVAPMH